MSLLSPMFEPQRVDCCCDSGFSSVHFVNPDKERRDLWDTVGILNDFSMKFFSSSRTSFTTLCVRISATCGCTETSLRSVSVITVSIYLGLSSDWFESVHFVNSDKERRSVSLPPPPNSVDWQTETERRKTVKRRKRKKKDAWTRSKRWCVSSLARISQNRIEIYVVRTSHLAFRNWHFAFINRLY